MEKIKITLLLALSIALLLYIGGTSIKLNPFKIEIKEPYMVIGWILLLVSINCFLIQGEKNGLKKNNETIQIVK